MIRVAAVGDVHLGASSAGRLRPQLDGIADKADLLLVAGDLTRQGTPDEAAVVAGELGDIGVPVVAVLGNHDHHAGCPEEVVGRLEDVGVRVLEGESTVVDVRGKRVGIAGTKGFGGGFADACATDFGEPEMRAFVRHSHALADRFEEALAGLDTDVRIGLLHYAPVEGTLRGERLEIFPFLGSYLLGEAADRAGCDLLVHGHAHAGAERGTTPGGVHVRNVAQPVLHHAFHVYCLGGDDDLDCEMPEPGVEVGVWEDVAASVSRSGAG